VNLTICRLTNIATRCCCLRCGVCSSLLFVVIVCCLTDFVTLLLCLRCCVATLCCDYLPLPDLPVPFDCLCRLVPLPSTRYAHAFANAFVVYSFITFRCGMCRYSFRVVAVGCIDVTVIPDVRCTCYAMVHCIRFYSCSMLLLFGICFPVVVLCSLEYFSVPFYVVDD